MIARTGQRDEQQAPFPLQVLRVGDRVARPPSVSAEGAGTMPSATPMTATAWNSRPFMPCMVPTRTASLLDLADSETVRMPAASSAAAASFTIQLDRAATPIACGSMPSLAPGGHVPHQRLVLGLARPRRDDLRPAAVQRGTVAGERVRLVVQAGHARLAQRGDGEREDLLGGAVVDREALAASADVDADARQRDVVVVDPLVRVADDEHVVGPGRARRRAAAATARGAGPAPRR